MSSRFKPQINGEGESSPPKSFSASKKIKFAYINYFPTKDKGKKFVKLCEKTTIASDLPELCLKDDYDDRAKYYIYINNDYIEEEELNNQFIDFYDKNLKFNIVRFYPKIQNIPTFYSNANPDGQKIILEGNDRNIFEIMDFDKDTDEYYIYNSKGDEIDINDLPNFKNKTDIYILHYPKKIDTLSPPELFDEISNNLKIKQNEIKIFLCILFKIRANRNLLDNLKTKLISESKYSAFSPILNSFVKSFDKKPNEQKKQFLLFIFSLEFIRRGKENYLELFERLCNTPDNPQKIFSVIDSNLISTKTKISANSIIQINETNYGNYIKTNKETNSIKYYDSYELDEKEFPIISTTPDIKQITGIFIDTSGSMLRAFNHTKQKLYEAALKIANSFCSNIRNFNIPDPLIICTSPDKTLKFDTKLTIERNEIQGRTKLWDNLEFLLNQIKTEKEDKQLPSRIVAISTGEDCGSSISKKFILNEIHKENVIVDSIILCDDEYSQDLLKFSNYTNGVYHFATSLESAIQFVSNEPFFNLSIRKPILDKCIPEYPFRLGGKGENKKIHRKRKHFEQLEPFYGRPEFYFDFEHGLLKPSTDYLREDNILSTELLECLKEENKPQPKYFTFLVRNEDDKITEEKKYIHEEEEEDIHEDIFSKPVGTITLSNKKNKKTIDPNSLKEMLKHWCIFIKFGPNDKSYFWQMIVDFDSKYPNTHPTMRIISHPELIKTNSEIISPYGTILLNKLLPDDEEHYSISKIINTLIKTFEKKFEYDKFESHFINSPVKSINLNLSEIIKVKFDSEIKDNDDDDDDNDDEIDDEKIEEKPDPNHKKETALLKKQIARLREENASLHEKIKNADPYSMEKLEESQKNKEFNPLETSFINSLHRFEKIGQGAQSQVFKVSRINLMALKEFTIIRNLDEADDEEEDNDDEEVNEANAKIISFDNLKNLLKEYEILNHLNHPNIIKTYGICFGDEKHPPSILEEFCPSSLSKVVKKIKNFHRTTIIYEISLAMREVHSSKLIHRDLKPENILLDENFHVKLCDFGISCSSESSQSKTAGIGTFKYMAPEVLNESKNYNEKIDVYSFGVVVFYILTKGKLPDISIGEISNGKKAKIPKNINEFSSNLINKCWSTNPEDRPSFLEIVEMIENNNFNLIDGVDKEINQIQNFLRLE